MRLLIECALLLRIATFTCKLLTIWILVYSTFCRNEYSLWEIEQLNSRLIYHFISIYLMTHQPQQLLSVFIGKWFQFGVHEKLKWKYNLVFTIAPNNEIDICSIFAGRHDRWKYSIVDKFAIFHIHVTLPVESECLFLLMEYKIMQFFTIWISVISQAYRIRAGMIAIRTIFETSRNDIHQSWCHFAGIESAYIDGDIAHAQKYFATSTLGYLMVDRYLHLQCNRTKCFMKLFI